MNYSATINYNERRRRTVAARRLKKTIVRGIFAMIGGILGAALAAWFIGYCIDVSIDQGNAANCDDIKSIQFTHDYDAAKAKCAQYYRTGDAAYLRQEHSN